MSWKTFLTVGIVTGVAATQVWLLVAVEAIFAAAWASFAFTWRSVVARA